MALLFFLLLVALTWTFAALQLWPRMRWTREWPLWLGGALVLGVVVYLAWGFAGLLRYSDWQALSTGQAVQRLFGTGSLWFQRSGLSLLDRVTNAYLTIDLVFTLLALGAASLHGYVFWAGVAERRRQARARRQRRAAG